MMKRTISGIIGAGSLAHNRRDFVAENVDPDRVQLNICYKNENLKEVYKELFDDAVERYNVGKRKNRKIANYYEKIRQGKQEKLFHEVIFQIGNREDMAVQELEQKKEYLTAENEGLTSQIADARADIKLLEEEKIQFQKDKETAERRAEKAETELKKLEDRREFLQPVMDNVSKEIKEYGMIKTFLSEATALERAITYRDKKIKPLFIEMKNKIGAMDAQVKELTRERDKWKSKFQKKKQEHENTKKELAEVQKDYQKLSVEKEILQGIADRYNRLLRMLGKDMVERLVQDDIRMQAELEAKKQKEQMPKKISDRIPWAKERSEEHNAQIKKNKAKYRGMEL